MVSASGAYRQAGGKWSKIELPREYKILQRAPHVDTVIRHVSNDKDGNVWLATDQGAILTDGDRWWHPLNRDDGMPYEDLLCLTVAPNGDLWGGTTEGAWRLHEGTWSYFWGKRWLPDNHVNSIAVTDAGVAFLATPKGVSRIEEKKMTLADKAAHLEEITQARHNRRGWVTSCNLKVPGELDKGIIHEASDNDGLWTALYVAAESYRFAATKDPEARKFAKQSLEALLDLTRLSGYPGFPARAIIRKGEEVTGYNPDETVRVEGETDKIWYTSPSDPNLLVKGDTSSDELDGHFFAYRVYFDLVADAAEKEEMRKVVRAILTNLLDHDYTLVGHTGRKTLWGVFGPQYLNDDPRWADERGLNSIEMLCYLKVAEHICGDKRFADAYNTLINKHHYLINTLNYRRNAPWWGINHSDDELAYCVYYPLIQLERDPHRRAILLQSLATTWNGGPQSAGLKEERAPFYTFMYSALVSEPTGIEDAVETLRLWPWELINWKTMNSQRHDVTFRAAKGVRRQELDRLLPISERPAWKWNGNPWDADGGDGGRSEEDPTAYLLPYWMGRYHRLIVEK